MALISCTECGKEISDKAKSCPFCGAPTTFAKKQIEEKKQQVLKTLPFVALTSLVGVFIYMGVSYWLLLAPVGLLLAPDFQEERKLHTKKDGCVRYSLLQWMHELI